MRRAPPTPDDGQYEVNSDSRGDKDLSTRTPSSREPVSQRVDDSSVRRISSRPTASGRPGARELVGHGDLPARFPHAPESRRKPQD